MKTRHKACFDAPETPGPFTDIGFHAERRDAVRRCLEGEDR